MKAFQKVLCGLVLGSLALGAGAVALSHKVSSKGNIAHAAVVDAEPTWDFHLEEAKIKGYTEHHFETMVGHDGVTETTAYVFSAEGNCSANPEVRFVTPITQTVTKPYTLVATETPVISVNFWYKLSNSSEKNVGDVAAPYLLQVLATDGKYPLIDFSPVNDGAWHNETMVIPTLWEGANYRDKVAGILVKAGDMNGSFTLADFEVNYGNAGSFVVTDIGTANVFGNTNDMIFVWVEGVGAQLDYPDVDGTPGVSISADVINGIGGVGSYSVDGEVRNLIGGQFYMNYWTRHQVFTFMPEGVGTVNEIKLEAGFRIPTASYINGGEPSYYTLAKSVTAKRLSDVRPEGTIEPWRIFNTAIDDEITFAGAGHDWANDNFNQYQVTFRMNRDFLGNVSYEQGGVFDPNGSDPLGVSNNVFVNDHIGQFRRRNVLHETGDNNTHINRGIIIGGKSLEEWMNMEATNRECVGTVFPLYNAPGDNNIYRPVIAQFVREGNDLNSPQNLHIIFTRNFLSLMDATITFKAEYFYAYNKTDDAYYGLNNDITFYPTLKTDGSQPNVGNGSVIYTKANDVETFDETVDFNNSSYNASYNGGKSYELSLYVDMAFNTSAYQQTWSIDNLEYLCDSILLNGVKASTINGYQKADGRMVYGSDYDGGNDLIPGNNNYSKSVLFSFRGSQLYLRVSKAALEAYTDSATLNTITICKNFTYINGENKVTRLASDKTFKLFAGKFTQDEVKEYSFNTGSYFVRGDGVGLAYFTVIGEANFGYNFSDKDPYAFNLEHIYINGKSIAQINTEFGPNIADSEYTMDPFNIYSKLYHPVLTWAGYDEGTSGYMLQILMHPKFVAHLTKAKIVVSFDDGLSCYSDSKVGYLYNGGAASFVVSDNNLEESSLDAIPTESVLRHLGKYKANGASGHAIKNLDQNPENLLYRKDSNGNTGYLFTNLAGTTNKAEFRFYFGDNDYYGEAHGMAFRSLSFDYMIENSATSSGTEAGASLTSEGEYYDKAADATKTYMIQLISTNRVSYYCFDVDLIADGNLHTFTLNIPFADVTGFNMCTFGLKGYFFISNINADVDAYNASLNDLVVNQLRMFSYRAQENKCLEYYEGAKAAYDALSAQDKETFMTNAAYGSAKARLQAWARVNGEQVTLSGITPINSSMFAITGNSNNVIIITIACSIMVALSSLAIFMVIRRRRYNK